MLAHNGLAFDSYIVINNLPQWRSVVILIKNRDGFVSPKLFNGYEDENKTIPQYVHFSCGRVHINVSLRNNDVIFKLQPSLLKQELKHDEIYEDTWKIKKMNGYRMMKKTYYQLLSVMLDIKWIWTDQFFLV